MLHTTSANFFTGKFFPLFLLLNVHFYETYAIDEKQSALVTRTTKLTPIRKVFLIEKIVTIKNHLPLFELESTVDNLFLKLSTLQYSTDMELLQPTIVTSTSSDITIFTKSLPLSTAINICASLNLPPLSLDNLPSTINTNIDILLHFEISVGSEKFICISPSHSEKDNNCLLYTLKYTKHLQFFRETSTLALHLTTNFLGKIAYLKQNTTHFYFSSAQYGHTACLGQATPQQTNPTVKRIHTEFYNHLNEIYLILFDHIDLTISHMTDHIHSFATDKTTSILPSMLDSDLSQKILSLSLSYLTNHHNRLPIHPHFENFFLSSINSSQDEYLFIPSNITAVNLLSPRNKRKLVSSLIQFRQSLTTRLSNFIYNFYPSSTSLEIPTTILYTTTQNPATFLYYIRNFIPDPDEQTLTETFILIQNCKTSLLQDISPIFSIHPTISFLSRSSFSHSRKLSRRNTLNNFPQQIFTQNTNEISTTTPQRSTTQTRTTQQTRQNTSPTTQPSTTTTTTTTTTTRHRPINITPPTRNTYLNPAPPPTNTPPRYKRNTKTHKRFKRSWGSFWGGVFSLATSDDIQLIQQHEMKIGEHEMDLSNAFRNFTGTNSILFDSLNRVTSSISELTQKEGSLFTEIQTLMEQEENGLEALQALTKTLDKTTALTIQYLNIQTQTTLLLHSLQKTQTLISSALSNTMDTSQIPTNILRSYLTENIQLSLQLIKSEFTFNNDGYSIQYKIPKISNEFIMYYIQNIPVLFNGKNWISVRTPKHFIINSVHETLNYEEVISLCTLKNSNYICEPDLIAISHKEEKSCEYKLYLSQLTKVLNFGTCIFENLEFLEKQKYIIKNNFIILASPVNDTFQYICTPPSTNINKTLSPGVNTYEMDRNCHYETNYISFNNPLYNVPIPSFETIETELTLAESLNSIDNLLEDSSTNTINLTIIHNLLQTYKGKLDITDKTINQIQSEIESIHMLNTIKDFSPINLKFDSIQHTTTFIAIIFWTVSLIILFIILWAINKIFPDCLCGICCIPFKILYECIINLFSSCRKANPPPVIYNATENQEKVSFLERHHQFSPPNKYPVLSQKQEQQNNSITPDWQITLGKYKNHEISATVIENTIPNTYYFHPISQKVLSSQNISCFHLNHPESSLIMQFYELLGQSHASKGLQTSSGHIQNADHPSLFYSLLTRSWHDQSNIGLEISGIKPPIMDN